MDLEDLFSLPKKLFKAEKVEALEKHVEEYMRGYAHHITWIEAFCSGFDHFFGKRHFSVPCFLRSCLMSLSVVFFSYLVCEHKGMFERRATNGMPVYTALIIGAVINCLPDYLSLLETRFILGLFKRARSLPAQLCGVVLDIFLSGSIIFASICAYRWIMGLPYVSVIKLLSAFDAYAIYFYSSFATSFMAWSFVVFSLIMRLTRRLFGGSVFNVEHAPLFFIILTMGAFVVAADFALEPLFTKDKYGISPLDRQFARFDPALNIDVSRLTDDEAEIVNLYGNACARVLKIGACIGQTAMDNRKSPPEVFALFHAACEKENWMGCFLEGAMYELGYGITKDEEAAVRLYDKACKGEVMPACSNQGTMLADGRGVAKDEAAAVKLFDKACKADNMLACSNQGTMLADGHGVAKDEEAAVRLWDKACKADDMPACSNQGRMLRNGRGVAKDEAAAVRLYDKACKADFMPACTNQGAMLESGRGVAKDEAAAVRLWDKACKAEVMEACSNQGLMLTNGRGVAKDEEVAVRLFDKACKADNMPACSNQGAMLESGRGVAKDEAAAVRLYDKACKGGYAEACEMLKNMPAELLNGQ